MRLYGIITYAIYSQTEINNAINPMYKYNDKTKNKYFHSLHDDIKFFYIRLPSLDLINT